MRRPGSNIGYATFRTKHMLFQWLSLNAAKTNQQRLEYVEVINFSDLQKKTALTIDLRQINIKSGRRTQEGSKRAPLKINF